MNGFDAVDPGATKVVVAAVAVIVAEFAGPRVVMDSTRLDST